MTNSLLVTGLARLGHKVAALAPMEANVARDHFAASLPAVFVTRYPVPHWNNELERTGSEEYVEREQQQIAEHLPKLIERHRPEVLILGRETFLGRASELARAQSIPCLLRLSGSVTQLVLSGRYPPEWTAKTLARYRHANLLVAQAEHMTASLKRLGISNIVTIPNLVDVGQFQPRLRPASLLRQWRIPDSAVVILHASNMKRVKRPLDIVLAAETVLREAPAVVYVMVGDGSERAAVEQLCREKAVAHRFRFVDWVDYSLMPAYMNLADVVVMPSEIEHQARACLEAQACGRVLVASDIPASREIVTHGESGLLFRMGDVGDLALRTLDAVTNPALRSRIGSRARARVEAHHSLATVMPQYEQAIHTILNNDPSPC